MPKRKRPEGSSIMDFFTPPRHAQSIAQPSSLISFYEGSGTDDSGRYLSDILRWGVNRLELSHDYIQTLFPLPERSGINDLAPTIDRRVFEAFRARADLREKLREAFQKMLWFYGFELSTNKDDGKLVVKQAHNFAIHSQNWLTRFDHNHLRITRIIRSLRVLGLEVEAVAFYDAISPAMIVSSRSRMYWERAAHRPLNIKPDADDEDVDEESVGPKFLREFEESKRAQHQDDSVTENGEMSATVAGEEPYMGNGTVEEPKGLEKDAMKPNHAIAESGARGASKAEAPPHIAHGSVTESE